MITNCWPVYNFCNILINKIRIFALCALCEYYLLYYGVLAYRTYKAVVERCLPASSWGVTGAMNVSDDKHHSQGRHLSFSCRITTSYILFDPFEDSLLISIFLIASEQRRHFFFQRIHQFFFLDKIQSIRDTFKRDPNLIKICKYIHF